MIPSRGYAAVFINRVTRAELRYPIVAWSTDGDPVIVGQYGLVTITFLNRHTDYWSFVRIEQEPR